MELAIYNVRGQRVRTLAQGVQAAGRYQIVWDGRSDTGAALASGVYLSRLASAQGGTSAAAGADKIERGK